MKYSKPEISWKYWYKRIHRRASQGVEVQWKSLLIINNSASGYLKIKFPRKFWKKNFTSANSLLKIRKVHRIKIPSCLNHYERFKIFKSKFFPKIFLRKKFFSFTDAFQIWITKQIFPVNSDEKNFSSSAKCILLKVAELLTKMAVRISFFASNYSKTDFFQKFCRIKIFLPAPMHFLKLQNCIKF